MSDNYIYMDVEEVDFKRKVLKPFCYSEECVAVVRQGMRAGVQKTVKNTAIFCPDCESALVWKESSFSNRKTRGKSELRY